MKYFSILIDRHEFTKTIEVSESEYFRGVIRIPMKPSLKNYTIAESFDVSYYPPTLEIKEFWREPDKASTKIIGGKRPRAIYTVFSERN